MAGTWKPGDYRDEFRDRLHKVIEKRLKNQGLVTPPEDEAGEVPENAATNVVDFMALLKKSLETEKRTPAKKSTTARKAASKKTPAKKSTAKRAGTARSGSRKRKSA
jgi:DNA end-binding protein Ku